MTPAEYNALLDAHGFPRLDDNPVAAARELHLINLAREHGDEFKHCFNFSHAIAWGVPFFKFPVATTANEQHKNTNTMNIQVNLNVDPKAVDAINNLAAAISGRSSNVTYVTEAPKEAPPAPVTEEPETPATPAPEPKKREKKAAPAPKAPEPDPLENVPTGAELLAKTEPLKETPYIKKLRVYMDEELNLKGTGLRAVTDVEDLKKIETRIDEMLAEKEAADAAKTKDAQEEL